MDFQNFSPTPGGDSVKINTVLKQEDEPYNNTFDMKGYTLQSIVGDNNNDGWPDSAFKGTRGRCALSGNRFNGLDFAFDAYPRKPRRDR